MRGEKDAICDIMAEQRREKHGHEIQAKNTGRKQKQKTG